MVSQSTWTKRLVLFAWFIVFYAVLSTAINWIREQFVDIPSGKWVTLYIGDGISVQLNIHTLDKVKKQEVFTAWVREDRQKPFSSGLVIGNTIFSKITVNCEENTVTIHEQRSFDDTFEELMISEKEVLHSTQDEVIVAVAQSTLCSVDSQQNSLLPSSDSREKDLVYVKFVQN
jgi:hypothetical protein